MNAFLQIVSQLIAAVPGSVWLEQRFFPFSDLKSPQAHLYDAVFFSQGANGALGILWCQFKGSEDELVTLPFRLARYSEDGDLISLKPWSIREASGDAEFFEAWRRALHIQNPLTTERNGFFAHRYVNGEPNLTALAIWGDTRNTCVRIESQEAYKIFRFFSKTRPDSVEVEILEYLNGQNLFLNYPKLVSVFQYFSRDITAAHVAISTRYINNHGTLWQDLAVRVQHARFPEQMQEHSSLESWKSALTLVEQLGRLLGEFHCTMSRARDNPRLQPEANTDSVRMVWFHLVQERLEWRLSEVVQTSHVLFGKEIDLSLCFNYLEILLARIQQIQHLGLLIRVHGNAHLGQILKTFDSLYLLDFETDHLEDTTYRDQKHSSLADVSAILLSLKYCWLTSERKDLSHVFVDFIDRDSEFGKHVQTMMNQFVTPRTYMPTFESIESSFLKFYKGAVLEESSTAELVPNNPDDFQMMLNLYFFLRVLKEILRDYQAGNPRAKLSIKILDEFVSHQMTFNRKAYDQPTSYSSKENEQE